MSDEDTAHQALSALKRIDINAHDQAVRDAHEDAVAAVNELAAALEESPDRAAVESDIDISEEWDDDEWEEKLGEAREDAEIPRSKGTITTKTIDEREYYYLQWREDEQVKSQYVATVSPS